MSELTVFSEAIAQLCELNETIEREYVDGLWDTDFAVDVRRMIRERRAGKPQETSLSAPPLTEDELLSATLAPPFLVEHHLYRDLDVFVAPGGSNKTTICLWENIHIALGRPLYGLRTCASTVLYVSGEDSRERLAARLHKIMTTMGLSRGDRDVVCDRVRIMDLVGRPFRLCELDKCGNVRTSDDVSRLIDSFGPMEPGLTVFDPLASFGAPETSVNDAAQGAVNAARCIIRELGCCVRIVHHTGQQAARENIRDQYAPRGGSALSDGARMVHVISRPGDGPLPFPLGADDQVFVLCRTKCNYTAPQPDIFIKRSGYAFEHAIEVKRTTAENRVEYANEVEAFLVDQLKSGRYHSKTSLETQELRIPRKELRAAVDELLVSGRVRNEDLPLERKYGQFKTYLHPCCVPIQPAEADGGLGNGGNPNPPALNNPPPYRVELGGGLAAEVSTPLSTNPPRGSAGYGRFGGLESANEIEGAI